MLALFEMLLLAALIPIIIADLVFICEIAFGLRKSPRGDVAISTVPMAILIPAHNEEAVLPTMLTGLAELASETLRVLVVADNCTDRTAQLIIKAGLPGVEVIERTDQTRCGKGHALAYGRDFLALSPPQIVVVLDADCVIDRIGLGNISSGAASTGSVVQAAYLFRPAPRASASVQISNFAFATKNLVRQRGIARLGGPAILTGSGMAFPWAIFAALDLATDDVVEDLGIGVELVERGLPPRFDGTATVWSDSSSDTGTKNQRSRWEGGFIATALRSAPRLLFLGLVRRQWSAIWLSAHLFVPPLTMLLLFNMALGVLAVALALAGPVLPLFIVGGMLSCLCAATAAAWATEGRRHIGVRALMRLPLYVIWKTALYARMITGRQVVSWTRTERIDRF